MKVGCREESATLDASGISQLSFWSILPTGTVSVLNCQYNNQCVQLAFLQTYNRVLIAIAVLDYIHWFLVCRKFYLFYC